MASFLFEISEISFLKFLFEISVYCKSLWLDVVFSFSEIEVAVIFCLKFQLFCILQISVYCQFEVASFELFRCYFQFSFLVSFQF